MITTWITGFFISVTFHFAKTQDTTQENTLNGNLSNNYIQLQAFVHQLHEKIQVLDSALSTVQAQLDVLNDVVGFTAYPSSQTTSLTPNTRIIFDKTITNIGNAYNPSNGSFICPRHGLYQFTIAVWCDIHDTGQIDLLKGDELEIRAVARSDGGNTLEGGGNTVILECGAWDEIWLRAGTANGGRLTTSQEHPQTTFSGMVIRFLE